MRCQLRLSSSRTASNRTSRRRRDVRPAPPIPPARGSCRRGRARKHRARCDARHEGGIVAGAGRHAAWSNSPRLGRACASRSRRPASQIVGAMLDEHGVSGPLDVRCGQRSPAFGVERGGELIDQRGILGADVEHQARLSGHDVRRVRARFPESPVVATKCPLAPAGEFARPLGHEQHECRGRQPGVAAVAHRRRAGMIGGALELDLDAGDADDRGHHAEIDPAVLENDALLDVKLQEGPRCRSVVPRSSLAGSPPTRSNRIGRDSRRSGSVKASSLPSSAPAMPRLPTQDTPYRSAPRRGNPRSRWSCRASMPARLQRAHDLERRDDAGGAVEAPAGRHRVGMRAEHDACRVRFAVPSQAADQIGRRRRSGRSGRRPRNDAEPRAPFEEAAARRTAGYRAASGSVIGGERHQIVPQTRLIDRGTALIGLRLDAAPAIAGTPARGARTRRCRARASTCVAVEDHPAAQEGGDRPIGQFDARVGTPADEIVAACRRDRSGAGRAPSRPDRRRVPTSIAPLRWPIRNSLAGLAASSRAAQVTSRLPLQQALEQKRVNHLQAGHAGCVLQHVGIGLAVFRPADVVGRDHRDIAGGEMMPERLDLARAGGSAD